MYKTYKVVNKVNGRCYYGMTKQTLDKRWSNHKSTYKRKKTKFYDAIKAYGTENFDIVLLEEFTNKEDCCVAEKGLISADPDNYNLASGGEGGFVVQDIDDWKAKLRVSRKGRKPSLGMIHTEENKKLFKELSDTYWESQETYDPVEVLLYNHKQAKAKFGISTPHYYRLRKRINGSL